MSQSTLASRAYQQVRMRIMNGDLSEGEKITEAAISSLLGIGRVPARETLLRLESDGLVHRPGPRCARYIKSVEEQSLTEIQHQYELREVVDGLAARKAALALTGEQILELRALLEQLDVCLRRGDRKERLELMHRFYSKLRQECGNPLLEISLERSGVNTPFFLHDARDASVMQLIAERGPLVRCLETVVDAIAAHDPVQAEIAMRSWTQLSWNAVRDAMRERQEFDQGKPSRRD